MTPFTQELFGTEISELSHFRQHNFTTTTHDLHDHFSLSTCIAPAVIHYIPLSINILLPFWLPAHHHPPPASAPSPPAFPIFPTPTLSLLQLSQTSYSAPIFLSFAHANFFFLLSSIIYLSARHGGRKLEGGWGGGRSVSSYACIPSLYLSFFPLSLLQYNLPTKTPWGGGAAPSPPTPLQLFSLYIPLSTFPTPTLSVSTTAFSNFLLCSYLSFIRPYKLLLPSIPSSLRGWGGR